MDKKKPYSVSELYKKCLNGKIPTSLSPSVVEKLLAIAIKAGESTLSLELLESLKDPKFLGTPLFNAVKHNRKEIVSALLKKGADVNTKKKKNTLLYIAAKKGFSEIVLKLLKHNADPMVGDRKCLDIACKKTNPKDPDDPYFDIIGHLLKNSPSFLAMWKASGKNSFLTACEKGDRRSLEILLKFSPNREELIDNSKRWGTRSPLHIASEQGNIDIVGLLIDSKATVNIARKDGGTPLYIASREGKTDTARLLIESKAAVDKSREDGISPLWVASYNGNTDTARLLIESKAAVDKPGTNGETPLYTASHYGNTDTARLLIESKAGVDKPRTLDGRTPLWTASYNGNTDAARLLIESKAAVDKADEDGWTPLILAARNNHMTTVRLLVDSGADTTIRGDENKTAAEWAKQRGHHSIAEYLDTVRFQPSARNERGELYNEQGRGRRAANRDLVNIAGFDRDMMGLLNQLVTGKR